MYLCNRRRTETITSFIQVD